MTDRTVSALVVLRPRTGVPVAGADSITAETVERFQPDPEAARHAADFFRARGFDVGPVVGLSFAITGPGSLFEATFGAQPAIVDAARTLEGVAPTSASELDLSALPTELRSHIEAVAFPRPPDFGPRSP
jgi:hypothetical protein